MDNPMALLKLFNADTKASTFQSTKLAIIMVDNVLLAPEMHNKDGM